MVPWQPTTAAKPRPKPTAASRGRCTGRRRAREDAIVQIVATQGLLSVDLSERTVIGFAHADFAVDHHNSEQPHDVTHRRLHPIRRLKQTRICAHVRFRHRSGFLLSLIDGSSTLKAIVDACGMPRADALHILYDLVQEGIVAFEQRPA